MKNLAIKGGSQTKTKPFPIWPHADQREKELLNEVVDSRKWWRMTGDKVSAFEKDFAAYHQVNHCLAVTNGTHALELALSVLDIQHGDEVIVPAVTFISTASCVIYSNATPVLVDIDPKTYCMEPEAFEAAITEKTKAVIPVHMAGHACDMKRICEIANRRNIKVIEDAAHGHGGMCEDKMLGSYGDLAIFSFQNGKIMTSGEGGALLTNNESYYKKAYLIHGVGRPDKDRVYEHSILGSNYRMNEFQAAILIAQLERLPEMNRRRDANAKQLDALLKEVNGITPQERKAFANVMTHYMYMFEYDADYFNGMSREMFIDCLIAEGIPAFVCFPVISKTTFFKQNRFLGKINGYDQEKEHDLSNANRLADCVVWIPHFTLLGDIEDIQQIAEAIKKIQKEAYTD